MDKLFSCPFCGSNKLKVGGKRQGRFGAVFSVRCNCCNVRGGAYGVEFNSREREKGMSKAIELWNNRTKPENKPLTHEEIAAIKRPIPLYKVLLTEDIGEYIGEDNAWWDVCCGTTELSGIVYWRSGHTNDLDDYGKTWLAYRYKPGQEETDGI
jgi:restriction alleviation protein, Lar family